MNAGASAAVEVLPSPIHGRGVFARRSFGTGDLIEVCPVLRIPAEQRALLDRTLLDEYYFEWAGDAGIALGYGSLYNHGDPANARYLKRIDDDRLEVRALTAIAVGEEITFDYGGGIDPDTP